MNTEYKIIVYRQQSGRYLFIFQTFGFPCKEEVARLGDCLSEVRFRLQALRAARAVDAAVARGISRGEDTSDPVQTIKFIYFIIGTTRLQIETKKLSERNPKRKEEHPRRLLCSQCCKRLLYTICNLASFQACNLPPACKFQRTCMEWGQSCCTMPHKWFEAKIHLSLDESDSINTVSVKTERAKFWRALRRAPIQDIFICISSRHVLALLAFKYLYLGLYGRSLYFLRLVPNSEFS